MSKERTITIPAPDFREVVITIRGITPLLCDRYGERTMAMIEDREQHPNKKRPKEARDPDAEYRDCLYLIAEANGAPATYGFPGSGIKKAIVSAGQRFLGETGTVLYGAISIPDELVALRGSEPRMRRDPRAIKGQRSSVIYRAEFVEWEMDVRVVFDGDILDEKQIFNLFAHAGAKVGIGNWRPEKKGIFGQFQVVGGKA